MQRLRRGAFRNALMSMVIIASVVLAGCGVPRPVSVATEHPAPTGGGCRTARGPFQIVGTRMLGADGRPYVPYGVSVSGLANRDYRSYTAVDDAMIQATANVWCSNTVRLQVGQSNLVGDDGGTYSAPFMDAVKAEVALAERLHLVVVLNSQTANAGNQPGPTEASRAFWSDMVHAYGHDPQVVFDLFNEPRMKAATAAQTWDVWQRGGIVDGTSYLGMQDLVDDVRGAGAANLLWIEGPFTATTLDAVRTHRITGPVVYVIHHPSGHHDSAAWTRDFGYLVEEGIAPVVDGEWTNYAAHRSECWPDAATAVPAYLAYLQRLGVGMTVWELAQGRMIESSRLDDPTHIRSNYSCTDGLDEGAGALVLAWYRQQNAASPIPTAASSGNGH